MDSEHPQQKKNPYKSKIEAKGEGVVVHVQGFKGSYLIIFLGVEEAASVFRNMVPITRVLLDPGR